MITAAILLSLATAGMHATWNVLVKTSGDPLRTSSRALAAGLVAVTPIMLAAWLLTGRPGLTRPGWLLAAVSAVVEVAYFTFLSAAYRRGELSVVYPLARGTAPLLAVLAGILVLGERPNGVEVAGIVLLLAGILIARRPTGAGSATMPAILTGVAIAVYTAIDKVGTGTSLPWVYGYVLAVFTAALLTGFVAITERRRIRVFSAPSTDVTHDGSWLRSVVVGFMMMGSYLLVLVALSLAPIVVVAPVRESAIVLVTVWGVWRLGERDDVLLRMGGAATIVAGIVFLIVR